MLDSIRNLKCLVLTSALAGMFATAGSAAAQTCGQPANPYAAFGLRVGWSGYVPDCFGSGGYGQRPASYRVDVRAGWGENTCPTPSSWWDEYVPAPGPSCNMITRREYFRRTRQPNYDRPTTPYVWENGRAVPALAGPWCDRDVGGDSYNDPTHDYSYPPRPAIYPNYADPYGWNR